MLESVHRVIAIPLLVSSDISKALPNGSSVSDGMFSITEWLFLMIVRHQVHSTFGFVISVRGENCAS